MDEASEELVAELTKKQKKNLEKKRSGKTEKDGPGLPGPGGRRFPRLLRCHGPQSGGALHARPRALAFDPFHDRMRPTHSLAPRPAGQDAGARNKAPPRQR